jgi:hypothetical protein
MTQPKIEEPVLIIKSDADSVTLMPNDSFSNSAAKHYYEGMKAAWPFINDYLASVDPQFRKVGFISMPDNLSFDQRGIFLEGIWSTLVELVERAINSKEGYVGMFTSRNIMYGFIGHTMFDGALTANHVNAALQEMRDRLAFRDAQLKEEKDGKHCRQN